ncbi:MAG: hypothetical protein EOO59_08805 [Hymenobacter sp.]|nr:MAG: hypothetical protein EOO59_08805 [Hymenobacter sp.]
MKVYLVTTHSADFIVGIIDIFLSVCICLFGWYCVVNEHRRLTVLFVALLLLHPAYIVFKWWSLYEHPEFMPSNVSYPQFVVLTSLTLFLRLALIISTFRCFRNFDLGLKDDVFTSERFAASGVHAGMSKGAVFLADAEAQLMDGGDTLEYDDGLSFGYPVNKRVAAY